MKIKIWTVAVDDDEGTRATVHINEKEAYLQWLEWQFQGNLDDEEQSNKETAATFIERENYRALYDWQSDKEFGEPFDTYLIEEHEIEIPT